MTEAELDHIQADPSMKVSLELRIDVDNRAITPGQRRALHAAMVRAAKRLGAQVMLAVEDHRAVKLSCKRLSSAQGTTSINLAEDEDNG